MIPLVPNRGGRHRLACADLVASTEARHIVGLVERVCGPKEPAFGYSVIGYDYALSGPTQEYRPALDTTGQIKSPESALQHFGTTREFGGTLLVIASRRTCVSRYSKIGEATVDMNAATVNHCPQVRLNCIIDSQSLVEHDLRNESHTHFSTGVRIAGGSAIGQQTFVGWGSTIKQVLSVEADCITASGGVVRRVVPAGTWIIGE